MKHITFIIILILLPTFAYLQTIKHNTKLLPDSNYVKISGTRISLFPPKGFYKATKFAGLKEPKSGASIIVSEMDKAIETIKGGFTKQGFATQGMDLLHSSTEYIGNEKALYYKATKKLGDVLFSKLILIFGNDSSSVMISSTFPHNFDSEISTNIEDCLLSAYFDSGYQFSAESSLGFKINTEGTKLKFAKSFPGTLIYTSDGTFPNKKRDGVSFKIGSSFGKIKIDVPKNFALERLKSLPYQILDTPEILKLNINNLSGYGIVAYAKAKETGIKILIYQVLLYTQESYYLMIGTAYDNFESNLSLFIYTASTFERIKR